MLIPSVSPKKKDTITLSEISERHLLGVFHDSHVVSSMVWKFMRIQGSGDMISVTGFVNLYENLNFLSSPLSSLK